MIIFSEIPFSFLGSKGSGAGAWPPAGTAAGAGGGATFFPKASRDSASAAADAAVSESFPAGHRHDVLLVGGRSILRPMAFSFAGKVAIVTGASSGIGLAVAEQLVAAGARVALVARTKSALEELAARLGADRAAAFPADVTDFERMGQLPGEVVARFGGLDILVNNAGLNHRGSILDLTPRQLTDVITTNLTAPIYLTRACADHLRAGGAVVNVASLAGMVPVPREAAYSASKAGLRAFTRVIAEDLAARGIQVSSVCPGPVDTNFFGDVATVPDLVFSQPMSTAAEVASAVLECIARGTPEIALPRMSGKLATLGYVFPALARGLRPMLEKRGAANKRRYLESKKTP